MRNVIRFVLLALTPTPVVAHNSSVTPIDVKIEQQSVTVILGLNQADLLEHILNAAHGPRRFADRQEYDDAAPALLTYVIAHLHISADGKPLPAPTPSDWPIQHVELTHVDVNGLETPSVIPLTLHYAVSGRPKKVEIRPELFAGPNFAALFVVTLYPGNGLKPISKSVDANQPAAFEIAESSIAKAPASTATFNRPRVSAGIVVIIVTGLTVAILGVFWVCKRGRMQRRSLV